MKNALKLYLVSDRELSLGRSLVEIVKQAVAGGVTMVQLREKETPTGEFVELARELLDVLRPINVPLIINDRVDVALAVDADGVHIGQSDMSYEDARSLLGPDKIIGLSVESIDDVLKANELDVDYIGISPVYGTQTKTDTAEPFGLKGLRDAVRLSVHPTVGIGGMNKLTAKDVMQTGCDGIAVVSAICSAENPTEAAAELRKLTDTHTKQSWSQDTWRKSLKIYKSILGQKFIKELSDGSLEMERFARYIGQDELYLKNYYPYMFKLADIIEVAEDKEFFIDFAKSGMEGEKQMHEFLIDKYNIDTEIHPSEVTEYYNSLIQEGVESGDCRIGLASMLPCMWIYNRVGLHILKIAELSDNPYKEWILEYGNEELTNGVNAVLDIIDKWAEQADDDIREKMTQYYLKAALCEFAFWDYGYEGDTKSYDYMYSLKDDETLL